MAPPKWAATPSRVRRDAKLEVMKDGQIVENVPIGRQACYLFGRNEDVCDHVLLHSSSSRKHAIVGHNRDGEVVVVDLDSAQGTFLNGEEIKPQTPRVLKEGDRLVFGASTRTYHVRDLEFKDAVLQAEDRKLVIDGNDHAMHGLPMGFGAVSKKTRDTEATIKTDTEGVARRKREEEIAAMTAAMMATPAPSVATAEQQKRVEESTTHQRESKEEIKEESEEESENDDEDGGNAKDDVASRYGLPIANDVSLAGHHKAISCIAVDAPGARVATGSFDYHVKLWDFAGMARSIRSFRDIEPDEGHPIVALSYSPTGDRLLVATGGCQPKVITREGVDELQFAKGDMYVVEMAKTTGHTHTVTGASWHPQERQQMITSSLDGTVRVWDLNGKNAFGKLVNDTVLKIKSKKGKRCGVTTCRYSVDGKLVTCGTMDGQIQCIDPRRAYAGASLTIRDAHAEGGGDLGISSVRFSPDGKLLASRACSDDTVKLWDLRKVSQPLKVFAGMEGVFGSCNVAFNATGTSIVAGTCVRKGQQQSGFVHFLDVYTPGLVTPITSVPMAMDESAVCVEWHHGINQIFVGSSSSSCRVLYDPVRSQKGVLLSATKKKRAVQSGDSGVRVDGVGEIHNPHALPMYRDDIANTNKRKYQKDLSKASSAASKAKAPDKPTTGPGMGGKIRGTSTFTQYFMSNHIKGDSFRDEDPREAILKYAKLAQENPQFTGRAYAQSQPTGKIDARYQLAKQTVEEEKIAKEKEHQRLLQP